MIQDFQKMLFKYCLNTNNLDLRDVKYIVYYEKPLLTFERLLETYVAVALEAEDLLLQQCRFG